MVTAILVDGAFYQRQAFLLFGQKDPKARAIELITYCKRHIKKEHSDLYRIFYYDCPPSDKTVFHPLTQKTISLLKSPQYKWQTEFIAELASKRKVAVRRGEPLESSGLYLMKPDAIKKLCRGSIEVKDLKETDFYLDIKQKGVDMRMGLDIASLSYKRQVSQIILISGDSDFVPAAKHARREGIDFFSSRRRHTRSSSLNEHIDGLHSCVAKPPFNTEDPLYVRNT